jgi:hypothetical protein
MEIPDKINKFDTTKTYYDGYIQKNLWNDLFEIPQEESKNKSGENSVPEKSNANKMESTSFEFFISLKRKDSTEIVTTFKFNSLAEINNFIKNNPFILDIYDIEKYSVTVYP